MRLDYNKYLDLALESLFRKIEDNGFWCDDEKRIIFKLDIDETTKPKISWSPDLSLEYRYGPYALMGALYWRSKISDKESKYDDKLIAYSNFLLTKIQKGKGLKDDSSGLNHSLVLASLTLSSTIFPELREKYFKKIMELYNFTIETWPVEKINDNQCYILLYSYCHLYNLFVEVKKPKEAEELLIIIKNFILYMSSIQSQIGAFDNGDPRFIYHQRMFLPLWGYFKGLNLIKNIISERQRLSLLESGKKGIEFACKKRMLKNGELYWHEYFWTYKNNSSIFGRTPKFNPNKNLFYEVHQCLFVVALSEYKYLTTDSNFDTFREKAINWIFINNKKREKFIDDTNLGLPFRVMTNNGSVFYKGNMFKGSYEVGIYIMALVNMIEENEA